MATERVEKPYKEDLFERYCNALLRGLRRIHLEREFTPVYSFVTEAHSLEKRCEINAKLPGKFQLLWPFSSEVAEVFVRVTASVTDKDYHEVRILDPNYTDSIDGVVARTNDKLRASYEIIVLPRKGFFTRDHGNLSFLR